MKRNNLIYFLFFAGFTLFLAGCIDSSDKPLAPIAGGDPTALLTAQPWRLTAYTVNPGIALTRGDTTKTTDLYPIIAKDSCTKDDLTIFKTDKTYTRDEGPTKCEPDADQVFETGTWAFSEDGDKLILTKSTSSKADSYDIKELSASTLKIVFKETIDSVVFTHTQTLMH